MRRSFFNKDLKEVREVAPQRTKTACWAEGTADAKDLRQFKEASGVETNE